MTLELMRDAVKDSGWWLLDTGSEQSFVDTADPLHIEFEYVQMMAYVLEATLPEGAPVRALHLGGGLCTVPRWLAVTHPRSTQRVAESSAEVAKLALSLGMPTGVRVTVGDALDVMRRCRRGSKDLVVSDVYDGPETVTKVFTVEAISRAHRALADGGLYLSNLSDATPFAMSRVVAAAVCAVFEHVVLLAEPAVLRGRRSGNLILAASDHPLPVEELTRRAAGGPVRARVVAGDDLTKFIGEAQPAEAVDDIPESGDYGDADAELATVTRLASRLAQRGR